MTTTSGETPSREALLSILQLAAKNRCVHVQALSAEDISGYIKLEGYSLLRVGPHNDQRVCCWEISDIGLQLAREVAAELTASQSSPQAALPAESALQLAIRFHETYERLAPSFGYETRKETRAFDPTTPNGRLMVAVCAELAQPAHHQGSVQGEPVAWHFESVHNEAGKTTGIRIMAYDKTIAVFQCEGRNCDYEAASNICVAHLQDSETAARLREECEESAKEVDQLMNELVCRPCMEVLAERNTLRDRLAVLERSGDSAQRALVEELKLAMSMLSESAWYQRGEMKAESLMNILSNLHAAALDAAGKGEGK